MPESNLFHFIKLSEDDADSVISQRLDFLEEKYRIKTGLKYDLFNFIFKNNLQHYLSGGELIAAEAETTLRVKNSSYPEISTLKDLYSLKPVFNSIFDLYKAEDSYNKISPPAAFFKRGDAVLEIFESLADKDIFGNITDKEQISDGIEYDTKSLSESKTGKTIYYKALNDGYFVMDKNKIKLCSPVKILNNNTLMKMIFFPLRYDEHILIDYFYSQYNEFVSKYPDSPNAVIIPREQFQLPDKLIYERIISKGIVPVEGIDAKINIFVFPEKTSLAENEIADYREMKNYIVVNEGELLFEKIKKITGVTGLDIYGKKLEISNKGADISISYNENIEAADKDDRILYTAKASGVFTFENNQAVVSSIMTVEGDIDYSTGNIDFKNSVIVKGNIPGGFTVKTGEDLIVEGSIENRAVVHCGRNLTVFEGIIGDKTRVYASGDISVKHVMEADLYTEGKCLIMKNIIGGSVFSRDKLEVRGENFKSKNSAMFGGNYYSMKTIEGHSAGHDNRPTFLCCGYNPYAQANFREAREALGAVEQLIIQIMGRIGSNVTGEELRKKIAVMNPVQRQTLKENLLKLKKLSEQKDSLLQKKAELEADIYSSENSSPQIIIKNYLLPPVDVQIIDRKRKFLEKELNIVIDINKM